MLSRRIMVKSFALGRFVDRAGLNRCPIKTSEAFPVYDLMSDKISWVKIYH